MYLKYQYDPFEPAQHRIPSGAVILAVPWNSLQVFFLFLIYFYIFIIIHRHSLTVTILHTTSGLLHCSSMPSTLKVQ